MEKNNDLHCMNTIGLHICKWDFGTLSKIQSVSKIMALCNPNITVYRAEKTLENKFIGLSLNPFIIITN